METRGADRRSRRRSCRSVELRSASPRRRPRHDFADALLRKLACKIGSMDPKGNLARRSRWIDTLRHGFCNQTIARGNRNPVVDDGMKKVFADVANPERTVSVECNGPTGFAAAQFIDGSDDFAHENRSHVVHDRASAPTMYIERAHACRPAAPAPPAQHQGAFPGRRYARRRAGHTARSRADGGRSRSRRLRGPPRVRAHAPSDVRSHTS